MLVNLGIGVKDNSGNSNNAMDVDGDEGAADQGEEEEEDDNYSHRALMYSVVEELDVRLGEQDVENILRIMNETLGSGK